MADETSKEKVVIDFSTNANSVKKDTDNFRASIDATVTATEEQTQAVDQQDKAYKTLKTQLREANNELTKSIQLYGETSTQAVNAAKGVANLKDQIGFAKDLSESFNPDQKFKALGAATQVAGTGLQGVTAGMALFGGESEDTQKQLLKVQAAMAFSDAISNLSNVADQWQVLKATISQSTLVTKANTAATGLAAMVQKAFTGSVATSTAGFKALKFAIAATGIGLLVVGLALVVTNFDKISKAVLNVVPGLASVGKFIGNIVESVTDFIGVTSEADRAVDRMRANADASIALNKKFLAEHGDQLDEFTKQKIEAKNAYNEAIKEDGANQIALSQRLNRELAAIEYSRGDEQRKIQAENAEKANEEAEKRRQKAIDDAKKKSDDDEKLAEEKIKNDAQKAFELNEQAKQDAADVAAYKDEKEEEQTEKEEQAGANKIARIQGEYDSEIKIEEEASRQKQVIANANFNIASKSIDLLGQLAGKNKAIQKAGIIASAGVGIYSVIKDTQAANMAAIAPPPLGLGPIAGIGLQTKNTIQGGLSITSIAAASAKALQSVGGGSAPSAPSLPSSQGISATPQTGFQASSENQISTSINNAQGQAPIIKAFVVGSEVTTQQSLDANLVKQNSFGGAN